MIQENLNIQAEPFSISGNSAESVFKISLTGDLNFNNYQEFLTAINSLKEKGVKKIIIDFHGLTRIDSTGIGTLISNAKKMERESREIIIVGCSEQILTLLKPIKLDSIIKIFKNLEDGIAYFS